MKNLIRSIVVVATVATFSCVNLIANAQDITFPDVPVGHSNYVPIHHLAEQGIVNGNTDGDFEPNKDVNRVEALKMILETFGQFNADEIETPDEELFSDTNNKHWYVKYLIKAKGKGMADGYGDGRFGPNDPVNLAESLKFLSKSLDNYLSITPTEDPFADTPSGKWYGEYVQWAKNRQLLSIDSSNKVHPTESISKGYLSSILYKLLKFGEGYKFGKATYYGEKFHGRTTASGSKFDMFEMTAAHKELPFGTIVEVMNLANGETIRVEITDRGPYGHGRVIDLSAAAFEEIASLGAGILNVQYKIVTADDDLEDENTTPDVFTNTITQE